MAEKETGPCGPTENLVKPMENDVSGQRGVAEENKSYGYSKTFKNHW